MHKLEKSSQVVYMIADGDTVEKEKSGNKNDDDKNDEIRYPAALSSSAFAVFHPPAVAFGLDFVVAWFKSSHSVYLTC